MLPEHPLRGKNLPMGPRFPDMSNAYDAGLRQQALDIADRLNIKLRQGVYLANQGPTYETPAEYRMYRLLGADAVGMSTVPEVIVAAHQGMRCLGMSVITNIGQKASKVTHQEVEEAANAAQPRMTAIFRELIKSL
jgi:purine-nucleoside phosphorylase